ncbi:GH25 family lysozyme [Georgenia faecalis]|uniref:GH25 family lysozyme n=1 Tax=Georgenia faecalis TaxID=2483799 RepID=UPI001F49566B|nr:GH25 family lysozyme [Georgenia faecalis]
MTGSSEEPARHGTPAAPASRSRRGRRWLVAVVALLVAAAALAAGWYLWFPHHRPGLCADESLGIDVSHHQGAVDWGAVAGDGIDFAYLKASEGTGWVDSRFAENWSGADDAGVLRGAYHFFTLCTPGGEQAEHFLRTAPPEAGALPPAVDLELVGNCSARPPAEEVMDELDAFLAVVEEAWGTDVLLYVGEDWEGEYPVLDRSDRPRWLVSFLGRPDLTWTVWQFSWWGSVDGIEGDVDLDVARLDELRR